MEWYYEQLTPNCKTLSRKKLEKVFLHMFIGGHLSSFFYDYEEILPSSIPEFADDIEENVAEGKLWFYACFEKKSDVPLGFAYTNNMIGKSAMFHFCFSNEGLENKEAMSKELLTSLVNKECLASLIGLIPRPCRHTLNYAEAMGFTRLGIIPQACYIAKYKKFVDGILTIYNPLTDK